MKKICLLAIVSFFSATAFCQNAATTKTAPVNPKFHHNTVPTVQATSTPTFTNAAGASNATTTTTTNAASKPAKFRAAAAKQAADAAANRPKTKVQN